MASEAASPPTEAADVAGWASDLPTQLEAATPQQRKTLMQLLLKELRVMSREEIQPTYKIPALVRTLDGQVATWPSGAR